MCVFSPEDIDRVIEMGPGSCVPIPSVILSPFEYKVNVKMQEGMTLKEALRAVLQEGGE